MSWPGSHPIVLVYLDQNCYERLEANGKTISRQSTTSLSAPRTISSRAKVKTFQGKQRLVAILSPTHLNANLKNCPKRNIIIRISSKDLFAAKKRRRNPLPKRIPQINQETHLLKPNRFLRHSNPRTQENTSPTTLQMMTG